MENKEAIIRKLNALRDMANHPSTEPALVESALRKFNKLMQEYKLTETDLNVKKAGIGVSSKFTEKGGKTQETRHPMGFIVLQIAEISETKLVTTGKVGSLNDWVFVGTPSDVAYADWLYRYIRNSMERSKIAFIKSPAYFNLINSGKSSNEAILAFNHGFRFAINETLNKMIEENKKAGNGLIVLKHDLIEAFLKDKGATEATKQESKALKLKGEYNDILFAGYEEGQKVKLRQEVGGNVSGYLK